jgi:hypothetical protein
MSDALEKAKEAYQKAKDSGELGTALVKADETAKSRGLVKSTVSDSSAAGPTGTPAEQIIMPVDRNKVLFKGILSSNSKRKKHFEVLFMIVELLQDYDTYGDEDSMLVRLGSTEEELRSFLRNIFHVDDDELTGLLGSEDHIFHILYDEAFEFDAYTTKEEMESRVDELFAEMDRYPQFMNYKLRPRVIEMIEYRRLHPDQSIEDMRGQKEMGGFLTRIERVRQTKGITAAKSNSPELPTGHPATDLGIDHGFSIPLQTDEPPNAARADSRAESKESSEETTLLEQLERAQVFFDNLAKQYDQMDDAYVQRTFNVNKKIDVVRLLNDQFGGGAFGTDLLLNKEPIEKIAMEEFGLDASDEEAIAEKVIELYQVLASQYAELLSESDNHIKKIIETQKQRAKIKSMLRL